MEKIKINQNGYTLIEVVVSLFVISVVMLIYAAASNSIVLNRDAKHQQIANRIAVSEMEDLRNTPFASMPASGALANQLLSSLPSGTATLSINDTTEHLKQATITVSWREPGNQKIRQVSLTTYIGEHGL